MVASVTLGGVDLHIFIAKIYYLHTLSTAYVNLYLPLLLSVYCMLLYAVFIYVDKFVYIHMNKYFYCCKEVCIKKIFYSKI